jgi:hypothetical protein
MLRVDHAPETVQADMVEMFALLSQQLSDMQTSLDIIDARTEQILAYLQEPHRFAMSFSDWATFQ